MKLYAVLLCCLLSCICKSQEMINAVLIDRNNRITEKPDSAMFMVLIKKYSDSSYERLEYNFSGPRIRSISYKDQELKIKHGRLIMYSPGGDLAQWGTYVDDKKNGDWTDFENGKATFKQVFEEGLLKSQTDLSIVKDTLNSKIDSARGEKESEFRGGMKSYMKFLNQNFKYPDRAQKMQKEGTVHLIFIVDKEGAVIDPNISKSVEYSMDEEALRIVKKMPKWIPAEQDGKLVKSYKKQPITFKLQ